MSFAIEVPGDANPLSPQELCRALEAATSSDGTQRQAAGQQLTTWELQPGYYSGLQSVFHDKSIPHQIRLLAIIQFKNGMDRYWRLVSNAKNGLSPEEKNLIRSRLFQGIIEEKDRSLVLQASVAAAKIVRIDQVKDWPNALSTLVELVRKVRAAGPSATMQLHSALNLLLRCVKELARARLRRTQESLQTVSPEIVYICCEMYAENKVVWLNLLTSGQGDKNSADLCLMNSLMTLRILRRLVVTGYEDPCSDTTVQEFWNVSQVDFGQFMNFISHDSQIPAEYQEMIGKHLLQFTKFHLGVADTHPSSFVKLPSSIPLVRAYWDLVARFAEIFDRSEGIRQTSGDGKTKREEGPLLERLALKGLLLLRSCTRIAFQPVTTFKFRSEELKAEQQQAMELVKTELMTPDFVIQIVNTLVTHLFIFRKSDLEAWEEDQEEWEGREHSQGNAYEWEVRPCAEKLFLDLLLRFKEMLIPPLMQYFQGAMSPTADIATKESIYTALGIAAQYLTDVFNFDDFIVGPLVADSQIQEPMARILRRRIAILLSQMIPLNIAAESKPVIYQIFRNFLITSDPLNDVVVRLTAGRELMTIVDDLDFQPEAFLPVASDVFSSVLELGAVVNIEETKLSLLESTRILVQRLEDSVAVFGDFIMTALPGIWESTDPEEHMIKQAIIAIFTALVMSMGPTSQKYHSIIIPLLKEASRQGSDIHFYLVDEGLELWNSVLQQSEIPLSADLIDLYESALPLVEYDSETAGFVLQAIESYILFSPEAVLSDRYRRQTLITLSKHLDSRTREWARSAVSCMEYLIQGAFRVAGIEGIQAILRDMIDTKVMHKIVESIYDAWQARQTTGPKRKVSRLSGMEESDYFSILARLLYAAPELFLEALTTFGPLEEVWKWFMDEWFAVRDGMDSSERRKLYTLALGKLMVLPQPIQSLVLGRLQEFLTLFNETLLDLRDGGEEARDCLVWTDYEVNSWDTSRTTREKQLNLEDPVHSELAHVYIFKCVEHLTNNVGGPQVLENEYLVNVDKEVTQQFRQLLS